MTKEDLLSGLKREVVAFDAGPMTVMLRPWSAATRAEFSLWRKDHAGPLGLCAKLAQLSLCDAAGNLLFGPGDVDALDGLDGEAVERIASRVFDLNGFGEGGAKN